MGIRTDFVTSLKESLHDTASLFVDDSDYERFTDNAIYDYDRVKPFYIAESLTLIAEQQIYDLPDNGFPLKEVFGTSYGYDYVKTTKPWEQCRFILPKINTIDKAVSALPPVYEKKIFLLPAPTALMIEVIGDQYDYTYISNHVLTEDFNTTDLEILLIRAQAEAMKEASIRNMTKPITLIKGGDITVNGTPAALYQQLLNDFEKMANIIPIT